MIKKLVSTAGSLLPPGLPAGKTLSLDSFDSTGDTITLTSVANQTEYTLPADARIDVRRDKIYSATRIDSPEGIAGRASTVKEVSGLDDYQVSIRFMLVSPIYNMSIETPSVAGMDSFSLIDSMIKKIKELRKIWQEESVMQVTNERLKALAIEYLFLKNIDLPDGETYWVQPVTIQAVSDDGK